MALGAQTQYRHNSRHSANVKICFMSRKRMPASFIDMPFMRSVDAQCYHGNDARPIVFDAKCRLTPSTGL